MDSIFYDQFAVQPHSRCAENSRDLDHEGLRLQDLRLRLMLWLKTIVRPAAAVQKNGAG